MFPFASHPREVGILEAFCRVTLVGFPEIETDLKFYSPIIWIVVNFDRS
jgi:hypothetical protein